jgi:peptide/nickel transport system substrate-binding protein
MYTFVPLPGGQSHFAGYTTSAIPQSSNSWAGANLVRYSNTEYDAKYAELSRTTDQNARNELIKQLSDLVVGDGAIIPLVWRASASAFSNEIKGWDKLNGWDSEFWNIADWYRE